MSDCIFCKIAKKEIPSEYLYEDDMIVSFKDLEPQAPAHALIIPKRHVSSYRDLMNHETEAMNVYRIIEGVRYGLPPEEIEKYIII